MNRGPATSCRSCIALGLQCTYRHRKVAIAAWNDGVGD